MPRIETGATGREAKMLPLCNAAPLYYCSFSNTCGPARKGFVVVVTVSASTSTSQFSASSSLGTFPFSLNPFLLKVQPKDIDHPVPSKWATFRWASRGILLTKLYAHVDVNILVRYHKIDTSLTMNTLESAFHCEFLTLEFYMIVYSIGDQRSQLQKDKVGKFFSWIRCGAVHFPSNTSSERSAQNSSRNFWQCRDSNPGRLGYFCWNATSALCIPLTYIF